jgi:CubicO group peptidase (beta-lactamase class C family)
MRLSALLALVLGLGLSPGATAESDWPIAEPSEVGLDAAPLNALTTRIRSNPETNIHSILIVKDGQLVTEEYFTGHDQDWGTDLGVVEFHRELRHDLRSVSKSLTSVLVGIAISEAKIPGVEANAHELFPEHLEQMAPDKRSITLHHILTMSAGLDWFEPSDYTNPGNDEIRLINSPDPVAFTLGRSLSSTPGDSFQYNGGLPTLLGYLLETAYGMQGDEILEQKLLAPLGIQGFDFRANSSGLLAYASGIRLRPRDMAKIGLLYLNGGSWNGQQIVPEAWVEASLKPHLESSWTAGYGYQWWIARFESPETSMWVPSAVGNGGQRIFILRPLDMVVVITAGNYNQSDIPLSGMTILSESIFPAAGIDGMRFVAAQP